MVSKETDKYYKIKQLFDIYYSLENFKKYICDMKVYKDFRFLIDLLSRPDVVKLEGLNIFIFEYTNEDNIMLMCPKNYDYNNNYLDEFFS